MEFSIGRGYFCLPKGNLAARVVSRSGDGRERIDPSFVEQVKARMQEAGNLLAQTVDLKLVKEIAGKAVLNSESGAGSEKVGDQTGDHVSVRKKIRLGIARDEAFCFYYKDNLNLLEDLGCNLVPFSPLRDSALPENLDGLILGGGYPELHGKELAENKGMLTSVRSALEAGMPCLAECGGFMYLHEEMEDRDGAVYSLVGRIHGRTYPTGKLVRFGYVQIRNREEEDLSEGYLLPGETVRGHEFHYWDSTDSGEDCVAVKPDGRRKWNCIHMEGNLFAGYPHLYLPSMRGFAERFVRRCGIWGGKY